MDLGLLYLWIGFIVFWWSLIGATSCLLMLIAVMCVSYHARKARLLYEFYLFCREREARKRARKEHPEN